MITFDFVLNVLLFSCIGIVLLEVGITYYEKYIKIKNKSSKIKDKKEFAET